jgi:integrase/recombinase XerD
VRRALVILNVLFTWLTEAGHLAGNPRALARRRSLASRAT